MLATGLSYKRAEELLESAGGHVKTAIVMALAGVSADEARKRIEEADGFVKEPFPRAHKVGAGRSVMVHRTLPEPRGDSLPGAGGADCVCSRGEDDSSYGWYASR